MLMKAAVLYHTGGPENFVLEERPIPTVPPGWVLVKIKAFGLMLTVNSENNTVFNG